MSSSPLPPPHDDPHPPRRIAVPANACDAHCHVFGPPDRFPYLPSRAYEPADTPVERYERMQATLGLTRAVFVQPAVYGTDHAAILYALERGRGRYAAVGIIDESVDDERLRELDAAGTRGARFNYVGHLGDRPSEAAVRAVLDRVAPLGWHLVFHVDAGALASISAMLADLPCLVVIDHMARLDAGAGVDQPGFAALLDLAGRPHIWTKISASDRMVGPGRLADAVPFMRAVAQAAPERTLWGTDWPHPNVRWMPDDGDLIDLLADAVPDAAAREAILVANPARLYDFSWNRGEKHLAETSPPGRYRP